MKRKKNEVCNFKMLQRRHPSRSLVFLIFHSLSSIFVHQGLLRKKKFFFRVFGLLKDYGFVFSKTKLTPLWINPKISLAKVSLGFECWCKLFFDEFFCLCFVVCVCEKKKKMKKSFQKRIFQKFLFSLFLLFNTLF